MTHTVNESLPETPPPELRYRRGLHLRPALRAVWESRHIIFNLARREVRVRYSQSVLGFAWALVTPLVFMVVFSIFLSKAKVTNIHTHHIAYPVFSYTGLLAWTFFSSAVSSAGSVLVGNPLLNKIYAPREVFSLATMATSGIDSCFASLALIVLFVMYGVTPQATIVFAPLLILVLLMFTVGLGLIFSSVTVYVRDLRYALPLMLQVGLFVTPVIYGLTEIPAQWRAIYVTLNPVAMVIDGLRRTILFNQAPNWTYFGLAAATSTVLLVAGYALFKQLETGFADVS